MRKLAVAALGYCAAVYLAEYLLPAAWRPWCAAGLGLCALPAALLLRGRRRLLPLLVSLGMAAGLLWSWGHAELFIAPAEALEGETRAVRARALDYSRDYGESSSVYARLGGDIPGVKALLTSYGEALPALEPGDEFTATVKVLSATRRYGLETDRYSSQGVFLRCTLIGGAEKTGRWRFAALYFPKRMARALLAAVDRVFPADTAAFMKALLLGDKTALYSDQELYYALGKTGFMHVVAVSGMHIAYLMGFMRGLTRSRKRAALFGIPLMLLFISMTGAGPSVLRAGFMQICMLLAPLVKREEDSVTSLSASLAVLLLVNPSSCASVSLQLSFASMAGIVLVTPRIEAAAKTWLKGREGARLRRVRKLTGTVIRSVAASLGGLVFSAPLVAAHFGNISLVSPLTNLLCLWAISFLFTCGLAAALAGLLLPAAGLVLGLCLSILVRGLVLVIHLLAGLPCAAVYTSNPLIAWWLGLVYVLFLITWLFRPKNGLRPVPPCCFSLLALCAVVLLTRHADEQAALRLTALDVGQGQCLVLQSKTAAVVVDCGGAAKETNAGDTAARYILGRCRRRVDALLLTHLHDDHANGAARLLRQVEVGCLVLPADTDDTDGCLPDILAAARERGTEVLFVGEDTRFAWGELSLSVFAARRGSSDNERGLIVLASVLGFDVLVTGDAGRERERQLVRGAALPDIEVLLAGHHGSKTSTGDLLLDAVKPELCIVSVGWNVYGHPAPETLERLTAHHAQVRRTDREGHIAVRFP